VGNKSSVLKKTTVVEVPEVLEEPEVVEEPAVVEEQDGVPCDEEQEELTVEPAAQGDI
jgi:hypothetical protein